MTAGTDRQSGRRSSAGRAAVCKTVCRWFESSPDLQDAYASDARRGLSPNLSLADSRQRPPAGIGHVPAVIRGSSSTVESLRRRKQRPPVRIRPAPHEVIRTVPGGVCEPPIKRYWLLYVAAYKLGISACCDRRAYGAVAQMEARVIWVHEAAGSSPACPTNAKAMCGAWLGVMPCPDGSIRLTYIKNSVYDTPERRGRGGRNPATSEHGLYIAYTRGVSTLAKIDWNVPPAWRASMPRPYSCACLRRSFDNEYAPFLLEIFS